MAEVKVELLTSSHDRNSFNCGREAQNTFLRERARKHASQNFSKTWVAVMPGEPTMLGYVTLSMGNISFENLTDELRSELPKYPMPVLHAGQLAVSIHFQGKGIGALLIRFAAEQAIAASKPVGCYAIELVADNDRAREWYLARGFLELKPGGLRLYQSTATLEKALEMSL